MTKIKDIFAIMNEIAPPSCAEEWDSIGLQVGEPENEAVGIMVSLDASIAAVEDAYNKDLNILITHHPLLFSGIKNINLAFFPGAVIKEAIRKDITIFSAHTNLDSTRGGINDMLCKTFGMTHTSPLDPRDQDYSTRRGLGRTGELREKMALEDVASIVKEKLGLSTVKVLGDKQKLIKKVSLCGGSGGSLIRKAAEVGSDLFISGDVNYHQAREAEDLGIALIDAGHFSSEKLVVKGLVRILNEVFLDKELKIPVAEFQGEKEPFSLI